MRLTKKPSAAGVTLDDPNPFDEHGANSSAFNPASSGGGSNPISGLPPMSSVRRRTATSSETSPNPYSSVPTSSDDLGHNSSPPAPTSDGSVISASAYSDERADPRRPLRVTNPHSESFMPIGDIKDRTVFLSAERGLQVFGGQSGASSSSAIPYNPQANIRMPLPFSEDSTASGYGASSEGGTSNAHAGSSTAPYVHNDAGPILASSSSEQRQPARSKPDESRDDAANEGQADAPPPAYEA